MQVLDSRGTSNDSLEEEWLRTNASKETRTNADESSRIRVRQIPDYEQIFREFAPYVLRLLPRLGIPTADVEDVCQEVFIAVYRKLPGFEGRSTLRTWLYGICLRTASNYRQRAYRFREIVTDRPPENIQHEGQLEQVHQKETQDLLECALAQLKYQEREVVVLFEIEQLSMSEVARVVGCSKFTAYARLYAARKQMKSLIRRVNNTVRRVS